MTIKSTPKMGVPSLQQPSELVTEFATRELHELIQDMQDTMQEKKGVGIAAPQIGVNKRVIMFGFDFNPRYPKAQPVPFTILINPEITLLTEEKESAWEGCISVPTIRGKVPRCTKIKYVGYDPEGARIERIVEGFHARVVQHECDHINGILFPERVVDFHNFGFEDVLGERIYD